MVAGEVLEDCWSSAEHPEEALTGSCLQSSAVVRCSATHDACSAYFPVFIAFRILRDTHMQIHCRNLHDLSNSCFNPKAKGNSNKYGKFN